MKILIPTCKRQWEVEPQIQAIYEKTPSADVYASCVRGSASVNRNACLENLNVGELAIMVDDDIEGFYPGWAEDLSVALYDPDVAMASARLLDADGAFAATCSRCYASDPSEIEVHWNGHCVLPTAAIAFIHKGHRFDETFKGSGWEDNDWCAQYLAANPESKFVQSNRCRLTHRNEMKNQKGENWTHNKQHFFSKWNSHAQHG